jgi:hypothetical protein
MLLGSCFQCQMFLCFWAYILAGWLLLVLPSAASSQPGLTHNSKLTVYVASVPTAQKTPHLTVPLLLHATLLLRERGVDCIENTRLHVVTMLFHSSGHFFWLHISCFEQICHSIVAYSLKARNVESQQSAVTRQWPINNNRGMVFSTWSGLRCYNQDQLAFAVS